MRLKINNNSVINKASSCLFQNVLVTLMAGSDDRATFPKFIENPPKWRQSDFLFRFRGEKGKQRK